MGRDHDYESKKVELENLLNNGMIDLEMYRKEIELLNRKIKNRDKRLKAEEDRIKRQKTEKKLAIIILIVSFSILLFNVLGKRKFDWEKL